MVQYPMTLYTVSTSMVRFGQATHAGHNPFLDPVSPSFAPPCSQQELAKCWSTAAVVDLGLHSCLELQAEAKLLFMVLL